MSIIIRIFVLLIWLRDHQRVDLVIGGERVDSDALFLKKRDIIFPHTYCSYFRVFVGLILGPPRLDMSGGFTIFGV
jgi:hypothetical protein